MTTTPSPNLYTKMATILGEISRLPKDGYNEHHRYHYTTAEAVLSTIRSKLAEQRIAFFARMTDAQIERITAEGKKDSIHVLAHFEFIFVDADTGETMTCPWVGEAIDFQDKGVNKAATAALKYFLLKTFMIDTGDDPDSGPATTPPADTTRRAQPRRQSQASRRSQPARQSRASSQDQDVPPPVQQPLAAGKPVSGVDDVPLTPANRHQFLEWLMAEYPQFETVQQAETRAKEVLGIPNFFVYDGTIADAKDAIRRAAQARQQAAS